MRALWVIAGCVALLAALGSWWWAMRPGPPPSAQAAAPAPVRTLLVGDPFAPIVEREAAQLLAPLGLGALFERAGYDAIRQSILAELQAPSGQVELVAFDVVWTAELAERGALLPLDELCQRAGLDPAAYIPAAIAGARWRGRLYGLPIQPHAELLWLRRDLLERVGGSAPRTPQELLALARQLHRPTAGIYGIVWNAQRGSALGQSMAHFYAAFGQPLLDAQGRPTLDGPRAVEALRFACELVPLSPPDILNTAWDQRRRRFIAGQAAIAYEWGARMGEGLLSPECQVRGQVLCAPPPVAEGVRRVAPFGTWCLGIIASVPPARQEAVWRALIALCGPQGARRFARAGNAGVPLTALFADEELGAPYAGLFPVMRQLIAAEAFDPAVRPATPQWDPLCRLLGEVYHDALQGRLAPEEAVAEAQRRALALWPQP
ncbi:MAG: extracellular solute-binding protein [Planctomycetota bacterium]|nr:extracellular solute-binding protein [Planctomycetota bacterium]